MEPPGTIFDEPRSLFGDAHAARCLALRRTLPRLEQPCVRAATALGVLLTRRGVPREVCHEIFALAFDLPNDMERLAEAARDDAFMRGRDAGLEPVQNPPLDLSGYMRSKDAALAGEPGLTEFATSGEFAMLSDSPEAYDMSVTTDLGDRVTGLRFSGEDFDVTFCTLFPFEAELPAVRGCRTLTIRSTCVRYSNVETGGAVRSPDIPVHFSGTFGLQPVEHTFQARRRGSTATARHEHYFAFAELARAMNVLPETWRQIGRRHGLVGVAYDHDMNEADLSFGRYDLEGYPGAASRGELQFGSCTLYTELANAEFHLASGDDGGHGVLDVEWSLICDGKMTVNLSEPPVKEFSTRLDFCLTHKVPAQTCVDEWNKRAFKDSEWNDPNLTPLFALRFDVTDIGRWLSRGR